MIRHRHQHQLLCRIAEQQTGRRQTLHHVKYWQERDQCSSDVVIRGNVTAEEVRMNPHNRQDTQWPHRQAHNFGETGNKVEAVSLPGENYQTAANVVHIRLLRIRGRNDLLRMIPTKDAASGRFSRIQACHLLGPRICILTVEQRLSWRKTDLESSSSISTSMRVLSMR